MFAKTVLLQGYFTEGRCVSCDFMQIIYDDAGKEVARATSPHTVAFMPDADHDAILAAVNLDITTRDGMKWAAIGADEWARAVGHCAVEHTPEVKAAYKAFQEAQAKEALASINATLDANANLQ